MEPTPSTLARAPPIFFSLWNLPFSQNLIMNAHPQLFSLLAVHH